MITYKRPKGHAVSTLLDVFEVQYVPLKSLHANTIVRNRRAIVWLGEMLGRPAEVGDLTDSNLRGLLHYLRTKREQSPITANGSWRCLCTLWRWANRHQLIGTWPGGEPLHVPKRAPKAWTLDELRQLVTAAARANGSIYGLPARLWWLALLGVLIDSGARFGELRAMQWEWITKDGWVHVPAEHVKGMKADRVYGLMTDTLAALEDLRRVSSIGGPARGPVFRISGHESRYYQHWDALLECAGLPKSRGNKTHKFRRTFASWLASAGESATAALGHESPAVTIASYIDPTIAARRYAEKMPFRLLSLIKEEPIECKATASILTRD